ncbi:MAG: LPS export ABC transporter ATP-binding protein [Alphaproteobacteria bacterium]|jgi:lipopolysaccharide export system ATP-binding protein|nr:LPS export ABC transporter ATP-binding protein [Alphaproteobacteria bacterium]
MVKKNSQAREKLVIENIKKSYGARSILKGISMEVSTGEVVGLLGPNGAGKTTSFYCITGLVRPDAGNVSISSEDVIEYPFYKRARMGLGYLPQEMSIFRNLTVRENIMGVLELIEADEEKREKKLRELIEEFHISHIENSPAMALSGGERRRVEIARALAADPKFVLFDEPFAGVDPIAVNDIKDLIYHLKDKGIGVLITDHNVRETLDITDKAYVVYDGKILIEGSKEDIINNEDVKRVYLGDSFDN